MLILLLAATLAGAAERPILELNECTGFSSTGSCTTCEIFSNRAVINKSYGSARLGRSMAWTQEKKITLSGDLDKFIEAADKEDKNEKKSPYVDGPNHTITAWTSERKEVVLFHDGSGTNIRREGTDSASLINLIQALCK